MGGSMDDYALALSVDVTGNVCVGGAFKASANIGNTTLTSAGNWDSFITKLDASGNFQWAKSFGGTANDLVYSIALDQSGNIYATGSFGFTVDFDPGPGVFNMSVSGNGGGTEIFVLKLNASGNFVW